MELVGKVLLEGVRADLPSVSGWEWINASLDNAGQKLDSARHGLSVVRRDCRSHPNFSLSATSRSGVARCTRALRRLSAGGPILAAISATHDRASGKDLSSIL